LEDAAQSTSTSSDISGDFFNSNRATKESIANLTANDVIMVPLFVTENAVPMDSTALAQGPLFATCLAYSQGTVHRETAVGFLVYFPPPDHILVANTNMLDLIETSTGTASDEPRTGAERANKRICTRMQTGKGEQPAYETSIDKGMSKVMFDLDGGRYAVRDKSDLISSEEELGFAFRAIDRERWDQLAGKDFRLQAGFILQQGRLREDHRHKAFTSCGVLDQVQGLGISQKTDPTKLLLMGRILIEEDEPTLTLEDFIDPGEGLPLSTSETVCPFQNRPMIAVLKNLQLVMEVCLSSEFKDVFEAFIVALEGTNRPLDRVNADFLKHQVEINLRKFFRVVSSERADNTLEEAPLNNPEECASFLHSLLETLVLNLKDHHHRALEDEYYRIAFIRDRRIAEIAARAEPTSSSKPKAKTGSPTKKAESPLRTCAGHFGKQRKATFPDCPYKCSFGQACKFRHVTMIGKTHSEIV
jgi:hypothetical protein